MTDQHNPRRPVHPPLATARDARADSPAGTAEAATEAARALHRTLLLLHAQYHWRPTSAQRLDYCRVTGPLTHRAREQFAHAVSLLPLMRARRPVEQWLINEAQHHLTLLNSDLADNARRRFGPYYAAGFATQ